MNLKTEEDTSSGIAHTVIITPVIMIRTQSETRCISSATSSPSSMVDETQPATNKKVRSTTCQNSLSPSTEVYWSKPTHGGEVCSHRLPRRSSWKDSTTVSTRG